jgi:hypothetical protein
MTPTTLSAPKMGRKPIGDVNLTAAERQRRYREKVRAQGGKGFLLTLSGMHLDLVLAMSNAEGITPSAALRLLLEPALDRHIGIMNRVQRMAENGASDEAQASFIHAYVRPELPPLEPRREPV